jgi:hypothetical protein
LRFAWNDDSSISATLHDTIGVLKDQSGFGLNEFAFFVFMWYSVTFQAAAFDNRPNLTFEIYIGLLCRETR